MKGTALEAQAPYARLRSLAAIRALRLGAIPAPRLVCGWCHSPNLDLRSETEAQCLACGRTVDLVKARRYRRQAISKIVREGIDPKLVRS